MQRLWFITLSDLYVDLARYGRDAGIHVVTEKPVTNQAKKAEDKCIARCGEKRSRVPHATQVGNGDQANEEETEPDSVILQPSETSPYHRRSNGFNSRCNRHRYGQNVIDQQR